MSLDGCGRSLLFARALQIPCANVSEFVAQPLKRSFGFVHRRFVTPLVGSILIEFFVTTRVDVFQRPIQCRLRAGRDIAAAGTLATGRRDHNQGWDDKEPDIPHQLSYHLQRASATFHISIHAVGSFGKERVICVSLAKSGERSWSALSAVIFARYGLLARCERCANTM